MGLFEDFILDGLSHCFPENLVFFGCLTGGAGLLNGYLYLNPVIVD